MQGQLMFKAVRQFLGIEAEEPKIPDDIREASHRLANQAAVLSAQARQLERSDPFNAFIHAMREKPDHGPH